jgi:hypothetical protein
VGFIGRIDPVAKRSAPGLIERHRDVGGTHSFEQIAQKARETVHRMSRVPVLVEHVHGPGMIGLENVDGSVDQINHAVSLQPAGVRRLREPALDAIVQGA